MRFRVTGGRWDGFWGADDEKTRHIGHQARWIVLAWAAASIFSTAMGEPTHGLWEAYNFMLGAVAVPLLWGQMAHMSRMCERCIGDSPLDPARSVSRWKAALRFTHSRRTIIAGLLVIFAWNAAVIWIPGHPWWQLAVDAVLPVYVTAVAWAGYQHTRLQPWCPFCDWDIGGEHEEVPDPDPAVSL